MDTGFYAGEALVVSTLYTARSLLDHKCTKLCALLLGTPGFSLEPRGIPLLTTVTKASVFVSVRLHHKATTLPGVNILPVFRELLQVQVRWPSVLFHKTALFH